MLAVLARAQASGDDDRILAAAKSVLAAHGSSAGPDSQAKDPALGFALEELNLEERQQMQDLILGVQLLKNRIRARLGRDQEDIPKFYYEPVMPPRNDEPVVHPPPQPAAPVTKPKPAAARTEPQEPRVEQPDPLADYVTGEDCTWGPPMVIKR
jgi:hypothetical protein